MVLEVYPAVVHLVVVVEFGEVEARHAPGWGPPLVCSFGLLVFPVAGTQTRQTAAPSGSLGAAIEEVMVLAPAPARQLKWVIWSP